MTCEKDVTALVVDDEPAILRLVGDALKRAGYCVMEAEDGAAALEEAARHSGTIDLLVTDILMPRVNGFELSERLASLHPETKVLFISGHADYDLAPESAFLQKPFLISALLRRLEDLLCPKARGERA